MNRALLCLAITTSAVFAQAPNPPHFEAADAHASDLSGNARSPFMAGPFVNGPRFEIRRATLLDLVTLGWSVRADKVVGGADWTNLDRFDILAQAPAAATAGDLRRMLQTLLADRFALKVHNDTQPQPALALVVAEGKKLHLKEAAGKGATGCKPQASAPGQGAGQIFFSNADGEVTSFNILPGNLVQYVCRNTTMRDFAASLAGMFGTDLGPNPVSDESGVAGAYDFDLKYSLNFGPARFGDAGERISFADAVEKQLGLKLAKRQVPMAVLVIDNVNRTPTPNPPGMTLSLPPLPTEFEVATVKPAPPDFRFAPFRPQRGSRVTIEGQPLMNLILRAWDLPGRDMVVGVPSSIESDRYTITAKAPTYGPDPDDASATSGTRRFQGVDPDSINVMLRNLLIERFKIKYHTEERPATAFVLTALKPKMKKADPSHRTGCHEGPGADGKDPRVNNPVASRLVTCENMTMKQFAQNLPMNAGGYFQGATMYDETGLDGAFDFTLNFSVAGMVNAGGRGGRGGDPGAAGIPEAGDPSGAVSLYEAIEKQLGLKLEKTKRPTHVLVIDHVEPKPADN
jgi:uncharacterized protein (TIGR03435 family)